MQWLNEPMKWTAEENRLFATSDAGTDFWRKTHDGGIRDHGHFYFESVVGNFTARVKQTAKYQSRYDHAGLMVRADDRTWLKCGIEFMDGRHYASAVVTRDWSDWSVMPIENPASFWILCEREDATFTVRYSLDGIEYETIRQAFLTEQSTLQVGMMLAAPKGNGLEVLFEDYSLSTS
jgi:regulation of enolase protein 1 (concanavalin A-like superfamily)